MNIHLDKKFFYLPHCIISPLKNTLIHPLSVPDGFFFFLNQNFSILKGL